ncbi:MAG TPA: lytic transglycosylase domain-containing protein, partial [Agitococcus sp.]|nr:lytic transglycosylase domain-containing protein [Agitococcus sp.]
MQYWLYFRKNAHQTALFALVSLFLSACTTTPQGSAAVKKPAITASAFFSGKKNDALYPEDYYDTTGLVVNQDDIDELLGVTEMDAAALSPEELASFGDIWARTRAGFKLDAVDNERIAQQRAWFSKRQDYLDRMTARASHYLYHTVTEAEKMGVPTELALLPIIESSYDPFATSPAQAAGLWQFIPGTGKIFGLRQTWWYDGRRDILESTRAAYKFLTQLYNQFGSWELALAAYNWGPGNIQ